MKERCRSQPEGTEFLTAACKAVRKPALGAADGGDVLGDGGCHRPSWRGSGGGTQAPGTLPTPMAHAQHELNGPLSRRRVATSSLRGWKGSGNGKKCI